MKTYIQCIPCFFNQAVNLAGLAGADEKQTRDIIDRLSAETPAFHFELTPPELSRTVYRIAEEVTGIKDPYFEIKKTSNRLAMLAYPQIKKTLGDSRHRLLAAVELAIAGNIIDYGTGHKLNVAEEIKKMAGPAKRAISRESATTFDYEHFKNTLEKSRSILYLADNAGEIVLDRILIEEIKALDGNKRIFFAVKEKPIINDALVGDAADCKIDSCAHVFSSGSDAPGTVLSLCNKKFFDILESSDMVISKGQGNFEGFQKPDKPVFYLFMAKCPVVALEAGCSPGDINLISNGF